MIFTTYMASVTGNRENALLFGSDIGHVSSTSIALFEDAPMISFLASIRTSFRSKSSAYE